MTSSANWNGKEMTFNEALGFTVNQYLFAHHLTRKQLGELLGVTGTVAGKKLRGQVGWSAQDVAVIAGRFGVPAGALMPKRSNGGWVPTLYMPSSDVTDSQ